MYLIFRLLHHIKDNGRRKRYLKNGVRTIINIGTAKDAAPKLISLLLPDVLIKLICPLPAKLLLYIVGNVCHIINCLLDQNHSMLSHFSFYPSTLLSSGKPHPAGVPFLLPYHQCLGQASSLSFHSLAKYFHPVVYCNFHNIHLTSFFWTVIVSPLNPILPHNIKNLPVKI